MFDTFYAKMMDIYKPYILRFSNDSEPTIIRSSDPNRPIIISKHIVNLCFPTDYLQNTIPYYEHKGVQKFYRLNAIFENSTLVGYITDTIIREMRRDEIKIDEDYDCIVTAESRGYLFASIIAQKTGLPLHTITKEGKTPGPVIKERYKKAYDETSTVEISSDIDLEDKMVAFIDDGIATGATIRVAIEAIRHHKPAKIVVAIPVASPDSIQAIKEEVKEVVCLHSPTEFMAISQFYKEFPQVSDEKVIKLLQEK